MLDCKLVLNNIFELRKFFVFLIAFTDVVRKQMELSSINAPKMTRPTT